jgi:hypothetical protein
MLSFFWLLPYLHLAHECDGPILESLWLTTDREKQEFAFVIPILHSQLTAWGYYFRRRDMMWSRFRAGENRTCQQLRASPMPGFSITWNDAETFYTFELMLPTNRYLIDDVAHPFIRTREMWLTSLFTGLKPIELYAFYGTEINLDKSGTLRILDQL